MSDVSGAYTSFHALSEAYTAEEKKIHALQYMAEKLDAVATLLVQLNERVDALTSKVADLNYMVEQLPAREPPA